MIRTAALLLRIASTDAGRRWLMLPYPSQQPHALGKPNMNS
jgi:hypothetical protein